MIPSKLLFSYGSQMTTETVAMEVASAPSWMTIPFLAHIGSRSSPTAMW